MLVTEKRGIDQHYVVCSSPIVKKYVEYSSTAMYQHSSSSDFEVVVIGFPDEFRPFVSHLPDFFGAAFGIYIVCRVIKNSTGQGFIHGRVSVFVTTVFATYFPRESQ